MRRVRRYPDCVGEPFYLIDALIEGVKIAACEILELNGKKTEDMRLCFRTVHWERIDDGRL